MVPLVSLAKVFASESETITRLRFQGPSFRVVREALKLGCCCWVGLPGFQPPHSPNGRRESDEATPLFFRSPHPSRSSNTTYFQPRFQLSYRRMFFLRRERRLHPRDISTLPTINTDNKSKGVGHLPRIFAATDPFRPVIRIPL